MIKGFSPSPIVLSIACTALLLAASDGRVAAQAPAGQPAAPGAQPAAQDTRPQFPRVLLTAGRSTVVMTDVDVTRIAITNPAVADAVVVAPREILVDGKAPGTVSLIVWAAGGSRTQYDLVVEPSITTLEQHLHTFFPGEDIAVSTNEGATILAGRVSSTKVMLRAAEIAAASMPKTQLINLLQVPGGSESQQVMLQVRFAEVNRRKVTEAGLSLIALRSDFYGRSTTQGFPAPDFDEEKAGGLVFSDFLNLFLFDRKHGVGGVLKALQSTGGFQSLAEPNLIAYNGQEASFLAGGEFPIPVVQGNSGSVTVVFKEFGIRLSFTPTIAGDVIRLKVNPEVSSLDFNNGLTLSGFRIPALITRRAATDVELRDGQTFAIAGLMNNMSQNDAAAIPLLSKLPIIGPLFKSMSNRAEQTELLVLITPRLVRPLEPDEVPPLPTDSDRFIDKTADASGAAGVSDRLEGGAGLVDAPRPGTVAPVKR